MASHACSAYSYESGLNDLLLTLMQEQREQERQQQQQRQQLRRQLLLRECATALLASVTTASHRLGDAACGVAPSLPNLSSHSTVESSAAAGCYLVPAAADMRVLSAHTATLPVASQAEDFHHRLKRPRYEELAHAGRDRTHGDVYQPQQTEFCQHVSAQQSHPLASRGLDTGVLSALIQQAVAGQVRAVVSAALEEAAGSKRRVADLEQQVSALQTNLASAHNLLAASQRTVSALQRSLENSEQQLQQELFREGSGDSDDVAVGRGAGVGQVEGHAEDAVSVCEGGPICEKGASFCFFPSGRCPSAPAVPNQTGTSVNEIRLKHVCRACKFGEASVVLLPCRHLALCRACEPRTAACPACGVSKHASVHISLEN
ncbi:hypothetical protein CLOP_g3459 [Closterium sp. NIES-67]|nr:hypothetical protein CLOP_g19824 [Closterium sp. NIES-67]GJP72699.1 hypothetical protein CLOP_g3459 [Closterium sp. NIES-67]